MFSSSKVRIPDKPYVVFVIGSTWENRNYPKEKFIKVAQSLNKICLVLWGNELERKKANWGHFFKDVKKGRSTYVKPASTQKKKKPCVRPASHLRQPHK